MAFPTTPTNGQTTSVNGTTFIYNSTNGTWTRVPADAYSSASFANGAFLAANAAYARANTQILIVAVNDDSSNVVVGSSLASFRAPSAMTLTSIPRATLNVASTATPVLNVDIKLSGTTILGSNKLTIDQNEKTSTTAATPTTLTTTSITDDTEITIDVNNAGIGAKGLKVIFYYTS